MSFLAPLFVIFPIYFLWIYLRLLKIPGVIGLSILNIFLFNVVLELKPPLSILINVGLIIIIILMYPIEKKFKIKYKEKKHLLPPKRFLLLQILVKPFLVIIPLFFIFHFFSNRLFANLTIFIGILWMLFRFWNLLASELQELYFRPIGKKATYIRFIETLVFTGILVIGYVVVCEKLGVVY